LLKEKYQELDSDAKEEGNQWSVARQTDDIVVKQTYKKGKGSEIPCYQCIGNLPFSTKELLEKVILDVEVIKKWSSVDDIYVFEDHQDAEIPYDIYRQRHKAVLGGMISPRDFAICRSYKISEDGTLRVVCVSIQHEKIPETPEYVRGHLYLTAWYATPLPSKPEHCKAHYVVHTNIKGSLPYWMVAKGIVGELADTFPKIIKLFPK